MTFKRSHAFYQRLQLGGFSTTSPQRVEDVIIIGAGLAGLAAGTLLFHLLKIASWEMAHTLIKSPLSCVLLEARDRVGGRVDTRREWGSVINLGARYSAFSIQDDVLNKKLDSWHGWKSLVRFGA